MASSSVPMDDIQLHDNSSQNTPESNGGAPSEQATTQGTPEPVSLEDILTQTVTSFQLLSSISSRVEGFKVQDEVFRKGIRLLHSIYPGIGG